MESFRVGIEDYPHVLSRAWAPCPCLDALRHVPSLFGAFEVSATAPYLYGACCMCPSLVRSIQGVKHGPEWELLSGITSGLLLGSGILFPIEHLLGAMGCFAMFSIVSGATCKRCR